MTRLNLEPADYRHTRFASLDKPLSRIHRWRGHQQEWRASGPSIDGWQAFSVFCSCGTRFEVVQ